MNLRNKLRQIIYIIVAIIIGYFSIGYFLIHYSDPGYIEGFSSNLLTTLLGIALGLPAALYIDRQISKAHDQEVEVQRRAQEATELRMLITELEEAAELIAERRRRADMMIPPLSAELWHTMRASARLRSVKDAVMLKNLGDAYNLIHTHQSLELMYHQHITADEKNPAQEHIVRDLDKLGPQTQESIDIAVKSVRAYLRRRVEIEDV